MVLPRPRRPARPCASPSWRDGARLVLVFDSAWSCAFHRSGAVRRPSDTTRSACAAMLLVEPAWRSRKRAASALSGTMPRPTSLETSDGRRRAARRERLHEPRRLRIDVGAAEHQIGEPQRQAIDQHRRAFRRRCRRARRQIDAAPRWSASRRRGAPDARRCARPSRRRWPRPWRRRSRAAAGADQRSRRSGSCRSGRRRARASSARPGGVTAEPWLKLARTKRSRKKPVKSPSSTQNTSVVSTTATTKL